ncbi:MAG: dihydroorotate dehydrogenase electron transfer subunit [Clostridia bacterium]|nr:dihydroorotate dehydrogenase electron transfer subunit [Clostridia bacterium]
MMKQSVFEITENTALTKNVFRMRLSGDTSDITASGQFVNIKLDGFFLRRPISVCDSIEGELTLVYKVVGKGTEYMSKMLPGDKLDILTGLGNGYNLEKSGDSPLLVGGGVGVPPLFRLAKELVALGKEVTVILGFNTKDEVFYEDEFKALGAKVLVATVDGSYGTHGFVTDAMKGLSYTYFYSCGPEPMLKALYNASASDGEMSFEERMGCGFGACMGCSCKTVSGNKRICKEGPVLAKEDIIW